MKYGWKFPTFYGYEDYVYKGEIGAYKLYRDGGKHISIPAWEGDVPTFLTHRGVMQLVTPEPAAHPYTAPTTASAFDKQVGGTHYTKMKIQPFQYSMANGLDPMQHTIVKYVSRFRDKGGIIDLEKAKQTIDLLIEWEKTHGRK